MRANQTTIRECLKAIEAVEMNPANVIGGSAAFFSGRKTELTAQAKRKVDEINRKMDKLGSDCDDE